MSRPCPYCGDADVLEATGLCPPCAAARERDLVVLTPGPRPIGARRLQAESPCGCRPLAAAGADRRVFDAEPAR